MLGTSAFAYAITKVACNLAIVIANPVTAPAVIIAAQPAIEAAAISAATVALALPLP